MSTNWTRAIPKSSCMVVRVASAVEGGVPDLYAQMRLSGDVGATSAGTDHIEVKAELDWSTKDADVF